jgi:hypothetical protein
MKQNDLPSIQVVAEESDLRYTFHSVGGRRGQPAFHQGRVSAKTRKVGRRKTCMHSI